MQNSTISSWGAQDKFMAHYIVKKDVKSKILNYTAKTILNTNGRFAQKQISSVSWNGGKLADVLNQDNSLNDLIAKQTPHVWIQVPFRHFNNISLMFRPRLFQVR